jgi:hypothetical protein
MSLLEGWHGSFWPDPASRAGVNHQQLIGHQRTSGGRIFFGFSLSEYYEEGMVAAPAERAPAAVASSAVANSALARLHPIGPTGPAHPSGSQSPPAKNRPVGPVGSKGRIGMQWGEKGRARVGRAMDIRSSQIAWRFLFDMR